MPDVDIDRLLWIVTGVQLNAELGDRPLAYRVEQELKARLIELLPPTPPGELPALIPTVISDVFFLNSEDDGVQAQSHHQHRRARCERPFGRLDQGTPDDRRDRKHAGGADGPGNARSPLRVWGMNHLDTVRAVDLFVSKYLDTFVNGLVRDLTAE